MTVSLIIPVKNELPGLKVYLPTLIASGRFLEIIVIDGKSTDGSIEYAKSLGCRVVTQDKPGIRAAYLQTYRSFSGDAVIVFSPDGNSLPEAIPAIITNLENGYDMVIASRYKDGAKSDDDTILSGPANSVFSFLISLFGYPYTDAMVMYRGYRIDVPKRLGLDVRRGDFYERTSGRHVSWEPLMSIRAAKASLKIAEIGFDEPKRIDQEGSGFILPATRISHYKAGLFCLWQVIEEFFRWNWKLSDGRKTHFKRGASA
ncbi:MAG: glycosyltransferase [Verrucomicrobiota bacterium]